MTVDLNHTITAEMAYDLAVSQKVCVRPMLRRVHDRQDGTEYVVAIPCGHTKEAVCPSCAYKARVLRMQQCTEGWHRDTEPDQPDQDHDGFDEQDDPEAADTYVSNDEDQDDDPAADDHDGLPADGHIERSRRVGQPGDGRTCLICPGCRWSTERWVRCSSPRTVGSTGPACS
jgi:hypothetical protein